MNIGILDLFDKVTVMEDFAKSLEAASLSRCDLYLDCLLYTSDAADD